MLCQHKRPLLPVTPQAALPLCGEAQCDVGSRFQESIGAAKSLCMALRVEHACLLRVRPATSHSLMSTEEPTRAMVLTPQGSSEPS